MQYSKFQPIRPAHNRLAFTLVEMMIVIVVIAILLGLLLPAVMGVFGSGRDAQVQIEIRSLEQGIAAFKAQFGIDPPSRITLAERSSETPTRDRAILRRIWPRFDFTTANAGKGNTHDWNGNGTAGEANTSVTLRGAECLVFFLGGMRAVDPSTNAPLNAVTGFSKNPSNPFVIQTGNGEVREGPFFEFKNSRLVASNNQPNFLVYIDPLPGQAAPYAPYIYASTYEGRGYEPADFVNAGAPSKALSAQLPSAPTQFNRTPPYPSGWDNQMADAYCLSTEDRNCNRVLDSGEDLNGNARLDIVYINPKTFQIISPGVDHLYGLGMQYTEAASDTNGNLSTRESFDNLTNFRSGRLKP